MTSAWHCRLCIQAWQFAGALCAQLECGEFKQLRTFESCLWKILHFSCIWIFKWRASLVPAAAVIPAPLAYTIIVAVKRLVVGLNANIKKMWIKIKQYSILISLRYFISVRSVHYLFHVIWNNWYTLCAVTSWRSTSFYALDYFFLFVLLFAREQYAYCTHTHTHTSTVCGLLAIYLHTLSTLWTNQSVPNMSFQNVHWMSYHGMLHKHLNNLLFIILHTHTHTHTVILIIFYFITGKTLKCYRYNISLDYITTA